MVRTVKKKYVLLGVIILLIAPLVFSVQLPGNSSYFATYSGLSTLVSGYISENTTWTLAGSPYIVVGDVIVESGVILTIEPGVVVKFASGKTLVIDGTLIAHGNATYKITFTSNATTPAPADYVGIRVRSSAQYASFDYCLVEYAMSIYFKSGYEQGYVNNSVIRRGILGIGGRVLSPSQMIIDNTKISENRDAGLSFFDTTLIISNSNVSRNGEGDIYDGGIHSNGGSIAAERCIISENNGWGIKQSGGPVGYLRNSTVSYNKLGGVTDLDEVYYALIYKNGGNGAELVNRILNSRIMYNDGYGAFRVNTILNSCVTDNGYGGVDVPRTSASGRIADSIISHNGDWGLRVNWGASIERCNITHNGVGIYSPSYFTVDAHNNNLFDNLSYDYQNDKPKRTDHNATLNWWGTTNESIIQQNIYDYYDDFDVGKVFYQPYLTKPEDIPLPFCPSEPEDLIPPFVESVFRTPTSPNYNEEVTVTATITDDVAVDEALLSYTYDLTWRNVSMNGVDDTFNATIPTQPYETLVQYKVYANDTSGNWAVSSTYSYTVSDDVSPEIVSVEWTPEQPTPFDFVKVAVNASEPVTASGVSKVLFSFKDSFGQWWNTTMIYDGASGLWTVTIPKQPYNATVQFYILAYDNAGNLAISQTYSYTVLGSLTVSIYTDKYTYHAGDTMHLGLNVTNPDSIKWLCFAIWVELPNGSYLPPYIHKHSVLLPIGTVYSNPDFESIILPTLPPGTYTWHAAFLERATHTIIVEDTAEWEFV